MMSEVANEILNEEYYEKLMLSRTGILLMMETQKQLLEDLQTELNFLEEQIDIYLRYTGELE